MEAEVGLFICWLFFVICCLFVDCCLLVGCYLLFVVCLAPRTDKDGSRVGLFSLLFTVVDN